jgi:subtilisin family serine protease
MATRRSFRSQAADLVRHPPGARGHSAALVFAFLCVGMGALDLVPGLAWAASGRRTEQSREQAEQSVRSPERSREDAKESDTREEKRSKSGDDARQQDESDKASGKRRERDSEGEKSDTNEGPPKTVLELIKRMTAPAQKERVVHAGLPSQMATSDVLAVGLSPAAVARARALGFSVGHSQHGHLTRMVPPAGLDAAEALGLLRSKLPGDQFGLNYVYRPYRSATGEKAESSERGHSVRPATSGGCDVGRCYGPAAIGWHPQLSYCAKKVRVGVIDTSIDLDHPTFAGRNIQVGNFLPSGAARATSWHGTGVMAVLAGGPNSGTPGFIPDAQFFAADVYHANESGQPVADTASLLRAIGWMRASKVDLINMSMSGPPDELLRKAIADMSAKGVLFVAAAGNGGPDAAPSFPAAYEQVIAVTAVDKDLRSYVHANHGDYIDIAAPGVRIWTAMPNFLEGYQSGTSFAAPHVTAVLAAMHGQVKDWSKEGALKALAIRDVGGASRSRIYGRGVVLAPNACSPGEEPGGWLVDIVRAPDTPVSPIAAGFTSSAK